MTRRGRLRSLRASWVLVLCLLAVAGPDARGDEADTLAYSETGYAVLDPAHVRRANDERLVLALYDGLTALDPQRGTVVPAAAERWVEAPDGRSWTFHLRRGAKWSDGRAVKADDFVEAWRRALDPFEPSPWTPLFRALRGCAAMADGDRAMRCLDEAVRGLRDLLEAHPAGVPGADLRDLIERSGVRAAAERLGDASVKRMLRWGDDAFPADKTREAIDALRKERRRIKRQVNDAFGAFGVAVGATAKDDHTLVVLLEHPCPWLPQLVARAPFAPLHPRTLRAGERAFEPSELLTNGAYRLKGRGPKPRPGVPNPDSVVHLVRDEGYDGPRRGRLREILCYTGQGAEEDLRRLEAGELHWMANPTAAFADRLVRRKGFRTRPAGRVVIVRLRADRPPFDDEKVRRAFALAVDRKALASTLWPAPVVAERLVPARPPGAARGPRAPHGSAADARVALKEAGLTGDSFPWVELHYEDQRGHDDLADALLKQWEKALVLEMGIRIEAPEDARRVRAAGAFHVALGVLHAAVDDPSAWITPFRAGAPDAGLGWEDEGFEDLLDAAADVDAFVRGGDEALARLPAGADIAAKAAVARGGGDREREALRRALLAAAEARLLEACVVIPLLFPQAADVFEGVRDVGGEAAWRHPAFVGSLRAARR